MAKPEMKRPEVKPSQPMSSYTFRPTKLDFFRMKRVPPALWAIEVTRVRDEGGVDFRVVLDPPDTLEAIERKVSGMIQEAERR